MDYKFPKEKLKTSKPTITGKEIKKNKDAYDTLNNLKNTSKRVIKDISRNQALFKKITNYTKSYKLHNFIRSILQTLKKFFHRLLKLRTDKDIGI